MKPSIFRFFPYRIPHFPLYAKKSVKICKKITLFPRSLTRRHSQEVAWMVERSTSRSFLRSADWSSVRLHVKTFSAFSRTRKIISGPVFRLVDVDFAARLESSRATCLSKNYFSPLISCVLKLILVVRCSGGGSKETDKTHH